jgi:methylornithine synthase
VIGRNGIKVTHSVSSLCARALEGESLGVAALQTLLGARGGDRETLFAAARELRSRHFGDAVFLYGFVYFSTWCRNRCVFCFYRAGNDQSPRNR